MAFLPETKIVDPFLNEGTERPERLRPFASGEFPYVLVRGATSRRVVYSMKRFDELYPSATKQERFDADALFGQGSRGIQVIPVR